MSRHWPQRFILMLLLVLTAAPASARIGNPIKKMKEKIQNKVESNAAPQAAAASPDQPPVFDDVTVELTDARIAGIVDAFHRSQKLIADRSPLAAKRDKLNEESRKLMEKEGEAMSALRDRRGEAEGCYQEGYRKAADKKAEEYKNRALSDPALREKFTKAAAEYNAAAAQGDSTAIAKLHAIMYGEILPSSEDSAAVRKSCGPMPPKSAAEIRLEQLDKDIAAIEEQIRVLDEKIANEDSGLNRQQWATALERIQMYLAAKKAKKVTRQLTEAEIKAIEKRLSEIEEAMGI